MVACCSVSVLMSLTCSMELEGMGSWFDELFFRCEGDSFSLSGEGGAALEQNDNNETRTQSGVGEEMWEENQRNGSMSILKFGIPHGHSNTSPTNELIRHLVWSRVQNVFFWGGGTICEE